MTDRLHHRGPDDGGVWIEDGVALGHRRLAIVDLTQAGAQPMHSECGRFVIVFNGEIYNHGDLRAALEAVGAAPKWRGHSDTETLLAGVVHWGLDETLRRASGMFAIALWDRRMRRLSLARDRIGEKPLYWGWADGALVFGSELKALRQHPGFPRDICRAALAQYLTFSYVPAPLSIHPGIYKLEPGCILEAEGPHPAAPPAAPLRPGQGHGALSIRRYWSLVDLIETGSRDPITDETEAVDLVDSTLRAAVGRQMLADVPLGAFLSGGIDSSLIVALMQTQSARPVRTFTIGFENPDFDESPFAAAVAKHLGTDHTTTIVTEADARGVIPQLPELYDEPFADPSQIPTHLVCRATRGKVTVALSGDAGDELFGGYNRYVLGPRIWRRLGWIPSPVRHALADGVLGVSPAAWDRLGTLYNRARPPGNGISSLGDKMHRVAHRLGTIESVDDLHRSLISIWPRPFELMSAPPASTDTHCLLDDPLPACLDGDPASRMMAQDMRAYLPDDILCKVDRAAMGVSLETRAPFLDPQALTLSARLPVTMKIRDGKGKWALRQALYRHVPRELIERPKTGFAVPVGEWIRGPLKLWAEELISHEALASDGLLNPAPVRRAWEEHLSGRRDWTQQLWIVLMFMAWRAAER